ncbi:MAG: fibronectin type III domain-containing protein [Candidatus Thermoplasmatota archaeon]|nr:fibronectin type III domain-containing protein [Candidatus Thermoplasmatota archaeon]
MSIFLVYALVTMMVLTMFTLKAAEGAEDEITIVSPNGGENIVSGSTQRVQWSINRAGGYISVYLSIDGGTSWDGIDTISNTPSHGFGSYSWFVPPNLNETTCRVQVIWRSSTAKPWTIYGEDISDGNFSITPNLVIEFTEFPTTMSYGSYKLFRYNMFDPNRRVGYLRFTWRVDEGSGFGSWKPLPGDYSTYDPTIGWIWWMPPYYESAWCEIRVEAIASVGSSVLGVDITNQIQLSSPTITLIQPDGGVVLVGGSTYTIKWKTSLDPSQVIMDIVLEYSTNGGSSWTIIGWSYDDSEEAWIVPNSVDSQNVIVKVTAEWGEWYYLDHDQSSSPNRIISDPNTLTVTLLAPNPPVDSGEVLLSNNTYSIAWSTTGSNDDIQQFKLYYSIDSGSTWTSITGATAPCRWYTWDVPEVDCYTARVRVELVPKSGPSIYAASNHDFNIFYTIYYNYPPIVFAGYDRTVGEEETVYLDGSGSYDAEGDPLTFSWTKIAPGGIDVTLTGADTAMATFSVSLTTYPVTFVLRLTVTDGLEHTDPLFFNTDEVSITVEPRPPVITNVWPDTGWVGTPLTIEGSDLRGAEILMGGMSVGRVLSEPLPPLNPDPDHSYTFIVHDGVPHGKHKITLRTTAGDIASANEVEIFPEPVWQFENGLGFHNPTRYELSYPWNPWGEGRYKDAFGNQAYLCLWVCLGIPYWTPWDGWDCWGYLIEEPFCPDPLAAIYYGAVFWWMAQYGECFGMSTTALRFYHDELSVSDYTPAYSTYPRELDNAGELREHVDYQQGAQMSSEILHAYLGSLISGLVPSSDFTGLGLWMNSMKHSIDTGDLGIATLICDYGAHAVVPYAYEEVDPTHIRFYVYDSNREEFSFPDQAIDKCKSGGDEIDNPPYIEVHKSGLYWDWSFEDADGNMWNSPVGVAFVPWSVVRGPRTMPLSIDGIIHLLAGSATVAVEDDNGSRVGYNESGSLEWGIDGAAPLPMFSGLGWKAQSWFLPTGNYTATVTGTEDGVYNWSCINNGTNAFSIERTEVSNNTVDTMSVDYPDGNPYRGSMEYGTSDEEKVYTLAQVNRFGVRERVYRIINATLTDTGTHVIGTNEDYSGIRFTNNGDEPVTFDVEFQGNVVSEEVWNGTSPPQNGTLPSATRSGITVGPGETVVIYPTNWLDLDNAFVVVEGETVPSPPLDLVAVADGPQVSLSWGAPVSDGGWPVIGYVVNRGEDQENLTFLADVDGISFTDDSVERGRTYYYSVQARNALGISDHSAVVSVSIPALTPPGAPQNITLELTPDGVLISWDPPLSDGGSPITGYRIIRSNGSEVPAEIATVTDAMTYLDTTVENGTTYRYTVLALNSIGESPVSEEMTVDVPEIPEPPDDDDIVVDDDDEKGFPWWLVIVIILGVALLLLVGYIVASSSRKEEGEE